MSPYLQCSATVRSIYVVRFCSESYRNLRKQRIHCLRFKALGISLQVKRESAFEMGCARTQAQRAFGGPSPLLVKDSSSLLSGGR